MGTVREWGTSRSAVNFNIPSAIEALPGRAEAMAYPSDTSSLNTPLVGPFPGRRQIQFGMGCFWGAEKQFWPLPGVFTTAVGYSGGHTPNPTYREAARDKPATPRRRWS